VEYSGNFYGTVRREVEEKLASGLDVILEIELEGARAIRRALPDAVQVFIAPPSFGELAARLRGRQTEAEQAISTRLQIAERELAAAAEFDYVVVNDNAQRAAAEVAAIITERRKGA
jgi:guanylate kinase